MSEESDRQMTIIEHLDDLGPSEVVGPGDRVAVVFTGRIPGVG